MPLIGNTVRITGEFRDFDGVLGTPTELTLTIYDSTKTPIGNPISSGFGIPSLGNYYYDYTIPEVEGNHIIAEWSGLLDGLPIRGVKKIPIRWL